MIAVVIVAFWIAVAIYGYEFIDVITSSPIITALVVFGLFAIKKIFNMILGK